MADIDTNTIADPEMLQAVEMPTIRLKPNLYNPNQMTAVDFQMLCDSMRMFGFTVPIYVNDGSVVPALKDMIIDGEHRWRAAQVLEMPTVPVVYRAANEADMRVSTLRHNEARGHHDMLMEADLVRDLAASGEMATGEMAALLHIDPVELDVLLQKSKDFISVEDASKLRQAEIMEELAGQGVTGQQAQDVARRHAIIDRPAQQSAENAVSLAREAHTNIKVEFVFTDDQWAVISRILRNYDNPKSFILNACKWFVDHKRNNANFPG